MFRVVNFSGYVQYVLCCAYLLRHLQRRYFSPSAEVRSPDTPRVCIVCFRQCAYISVAPVEHSLCNRLKRLRGLKFSHERRRVWVEFCRNTSLRNKTPQQLRERAVCSRHFKPSAFLYRERLRRDAIPAYLTTEGAGDAVQSSSPGQLISEGEPTLACSSSTDGHTSSRCHTHHTTEEDVGSSLTALTSGTKTSPPTRVHVDHTYSMQGAMDGHGPPSGGNDVGVPEPSPTDYDASVSSTSAVPHQRSCATRTEGKGKMDVLRARLRQLRTHNKRLQQRLQRRRHMLTVTEIVESVRSLVSPAVAALVEAQLKMTNASRFGRRWCSQNKEFALGLYF
ncbi:uncharacterized protein LOC120847054 isoform X1 [Ixodes scapularis]|uniref:uncharacterized protein LOC120847054 isoform X1 n=1 Tax=Ixodes scapularis TaxID=6945 RepID=UPI001A9E939C|nr:uncharacterized protein LOC120847054 isoform X1 [Ixodes scapularis]